MFMSTNHEQLLRVASPENGVVAALNTEQMAGMIKGHSTITKVSWKLLPAQHC